ncbi:MAG: histidine ammonia-lyase [Simkaniaceae bacterium]
MNMLSTENNPLKAQQAIYIDGNNLSTGDVFKIVSQKMQISISDETALQIQKSRTLLEEFIFQQRIIYGVNTSLGGFVNWLIPDNCAQELQDNLISAVATNVGQYLDDLYVRASMLARLNSLARGVSAISLDNFYILMEMFNKEVIPCIPSKGSLGASGDLGPLACIALVGTGKWKAKYQGKILPGAEALKKADIQPMKLSHKEGLSLINGTSTMTGMSAFLVEEAINLVKTYDIISSLSFEGLQIKKKPLHPIVHKHKLHRGQQITAQNLWKLLEDSKMVLDEDFIEKQLRSSRKDVPHSFKSAIEDAYSIRCTPQIIGPIRDCLLSIKETINNELNSSSDNPLILPEQKDIFHNGHFHGQYISMAMDQLSISLTTLSNLSDRRIDRFMDANNSNGLPAFLCAENPGLRLGLMGGQFMATSVTAENRSLCTPMSIQTLTSTGDFQDIVSLGLVAARKAEEILNNTIYAVAFELLCAAQAVEIRGIELLSRGTRAAFDCVREVVPYLSKDECLTDHLEELSRLIRSGKILRKVEKIVGDLAL